MATMDHFPNPELLEGRSLQERWIWDQLCQGKIADFNQGNDYGGGKPPRTPEGWPENRFVSADFLESVLTSENFPASVKRYGLRIIGARINEPFQLDYVTLQFPIALVNCRFEKEISCTRLHSLYDFSLKGSFMGSGLDWSRSTVGGQLDLSGAKVTGRLDMNGLQVAQHLFMHEGAEFTEIDLTAAKVGDQLDLSGAKVTGRLDMNGLQVAQGLFMREGAEFMEVILYAAKVGGSFQFQGSTIRGPLDLRHCSVDYFVDSRNWPQRYQINGFRYRQLIHDTAVREIKLFETWLANQAEFSPQSYDTLAQVLEQAGYKTKANAVRFAGKQHQKRLADWRQRLILFFQLIFVGYGFKVYFAVIWVVILTVIGIGALESIQLPHSEKLGTLRELGFYTIDMLLPIVELNSDHKQITSQLSASVQTYFYFLKLMGWVLASFLVAGLSGLTKK